MLPDFGFSQLRDVGALERGGDIVALCLQCSSRDIVKHCVSHNSSRSDIVMTEEMLAVMTLSSSEASSG